MPNLEFRINPNKEPDAYAKMYDGQLIPVSIINASELVTYPNIELVNYFTWRNDTTSLSYNPYWYDVSSSLTTNLYGNAETCVQLFYNKNNKGQLLRKRIGQNGEESAGGPTVESIGYDGSLVLIQGMYNGIERSGHDIDSLVLFAGLYVNTDFILTTIGHIGYQVLNESYESKFNSKTWSGVKILGVDQVFPGPSSDKGGSNGDFDNTSDVIPIPGAPKLSATSTGFLSIYNPTLSQLEELANYMWSSDFTTNDLLKMFANPIDVILGLNILPVAIPNSGAVEIKVGGISTGVSMNKGTAQYVMLDCGSITLKEFWGSYLDYAPYTKIQIYLPYIGYKELNADEVMNKEIDVVYYVDILTGVCIAYVRSGDTVLYQFNGQCAQTIPVTANDFSALIGTIAILVASAGISIASGGVGSGVASDMIGQATAASAGLNLPTSATGVLALASSGVGAVMGSKPSFERSGTISGVVGQLAIQKPYIIITRPRQSLAKNYKSYQGYPSNITSRLGDLSGFTKVEKIKLENMSSTLLETNEIYKLLGEGVII